MKLIVALENSYKSNIFKFFNISNSQKTLKTSKNNKYSKKDHYFSIF